MPNMSYCRFENTYDDLGDCHNALVEIVDDGKDISEREKKYAAKLVKLCKEIADNFPEFLEERNS